MPKIMWQSSGWLKGLTPTAKRLAKSASIRASRHGARRVILDGLEELRAEMDDRRDELFHDLSALLEHEAREAQSYDLPEPLVSDDDTEGLGRPFPPHTDYPCQRCGGHCIMDFMDFDDLREERRGQDLWADRDHYDDFYG